MKAVAGWIVACCWLVAVATTARTQGKEYTGTLDTELIVDEHFLTPRLLRPASPDEIAKLRIHLVIADQGLTWPQATKESIRDLIKVRYRSLRIHHTYSWIQKERSSRWVGSINLHCKERT